MEKAGIYGSQFKHGIYPDFIASCLEFKRTLFPSLILATEGQLGK